jgi:hypothetical protein
MRFAEESAGPDVAYLPRPGQGGTFLISQPDLDACTTAFTQLSSAALSPRESAQLLRQIAQDTGTARITPDRLAAAVGLCVPDE